MKKSIFKTFMLVAAGALLFASCEDKTSDDSISAELITEDETIALTEADDITDEIDNAVDDILNEEFGFLSKEEASKNDENDKHKRPECLTKTIVLEGTSKTVTLDFGESCELPNGHSISGQIVMSFAFNLEAKSITITKTFQDFFFNEVSVQGSNTIEKTWENNEGNTQSIKTMNIELTWTDGKTAVRTGTKTREWVEGKETKTWGDNVFIITGNTTTTFNDGTVFTSEIDEPLRREMSCKFIVSGTVEISKGEKIGTLDFGDGSCDDQATFTSSDNEVTEITLRKRKMRN